MASAKKKSKLTIPAAIEEIERALFDQEEPGIRDTEWGELVLTEVGQIRLTRILRRLQQRK